MSKDLSQLVFDTFIKQRKADKRDQQSASTQMAYIPGFLLGVISNVSCPLILLMAPSADGGTVSDSSSITKTRASLEELDHRRWERFQALTACSQPYFHSVLSFPKDSSE